MSTETRMINQVHWRGVLPAKLGTYVQNTTSVENETEVLFTVPADTVYLVHNLYFHSRNVSAGALQSYLCLFLTDGSAFQYLVNLILQPAEAVSVPFLFPLPYILTAGQSARARSYGTGNIIVVSWRVESVLAGGVL